MVLQGGVTENVFLPSPSVGNAGGFNLGLPKLDIDPNFDSFYSNNTFGINPYDQGSVFGPSSPRDTIFTRPYQYLSTPSNPTVSPPLDEVEYQADPVTDYVLDPTTGTAFPTQQGGGRSSLLLLAAAGAAAWYYYAKKKKKGKK